MQIVSDEAALRQYLKTAVEMDADKPVLVDKYIRGKEVEVERSVTAGMYLCRALWSW